MSDEQKQYIIDDDLLAEIDSKLDPSTDIGLRYKILKVRSLPLSQHTSTPAPLTKFVEHLSRINQELNVVSGKLENLQKIIDADEMTSELWDDYANLEGWREALDWAILADSDLTLQQHDATIRNATLDELKERFIYRQSEMKRLRDEAKFTEYNFVLSVIESLRTSTGKGDDAP